MLLSIDQLSKEAFISSLFILGVTKTTEGIKQFIKDNKEKYCTALYKTTIKHNESLIEGSEVFTTPGTRLWCMRESAAKKDQATYNLIMEVLRTNN